ncbi:MAG: sulfotransferase [Candidatus Theseobacter exili]|nr:sulfotransferase [Candidatus Theseobacter exili]
MNISVKEPRYSIKIKSSPIIILGMHRSGTTLVSEILSSMGVFFGKVKSHYESPFFKDINKWILKKTHAEWDMPVNIWKLLCEQQDLKKAFIYQLKRKTFSPSFLLRFANLKSISNFISNPNFIWAWKDPRTTFTWPLWNSVFQSAKYIFVYRNGVDVANSLKTRERNRNNPIFGKTMSIRCSDIKRAYELWEEYNTLFFQLKNSFPNLPLLEISYENLVRNPEKEIMKISSFSGVSPNTKEINLICNKIDSSKLFQFLKKPELVNLFETIRERPLMKQFGYDQINLK